MCSSDCHNWNNLLRKQFDHLILRKKQTNMYHYQHLSPIYSNLYNNQLDELDYFLHLPNYYTL